MKNDAIRQFVRRELRAVTMGIAATAIGIGGGLPAARATGLTGGTVVSGQGSISNPNATTTLINQQSNSLALNWSTFNVASNETVRFVQPSRTSVALNNVLSANPSQIFGRIDANGRVVLINPNGILFGRTAQLNVGSLIASSLELKEYDPTTGHLSFQSLGGHPGVIDNEGSITAARGGSVALLGGTVLNNGMILADYGSVAMGAGQVATLDFYGGGLLRLQVSGDLKTNSSGAAAAVQNNSQVAANGGQVVLTAAATRDVFASAVNNTGVIRANRVQNVGGVIELSGPDGVVANSGTLDASGTGAGSTGGTVKVTGNDVGLFAGSAINASAPAGGGTVLVGGGFHGANPNVEDAAHTYVGAGTTIAADATESGNGGDVAVWSNDTTRYYGSIFARGAGQGFGGYTEVSGKGYLDYQGQVDLRAPAGKTGTLLLDPTEITVEHGADGTDTNITTAGTFTDTSSGAGSILMDGTINTQLGTANVTVTTSTGDIVISNTAGAVAIAPTTANANTLTLNSAANVSWNAGWTYTNNGQLTLYAAGGSISTNATGQAITLGGTSPLLMQASGGIGASSIPIETSGLTSVAAATGTGGIYISNSGGSNVSVDSLTNPVTTNAVNGLNASGGTDVSLNNTGGSITLTQPAVAGTGTVTLAAVGALALGANNVTAGAGVTLEGAGVTQSSGSTVNAGSGDILVNGGGGAVSMAGALTTTSSTATAATVRNATTVALPAITTGTSGTTTIGAGDISGAVTQSGTTTLSTGTLTGDTTSTVSLGNGNTIPTVSAFTSTGFTLNTGDPLSITGTLAGGAGGATLTSSGTISESGSGLISGLGTLTTSSVGGTTLGGANSVAGFNATNTTNGNVTLTNAAALTITGITQSGGGSVTVDNAGGTTLTGAVGGAGTGAVTLQDTSGALALGTNNVTGAGVTLQGTGVTQSATSTVNAGAGDILVNGGGGTVAMAGALTTTSNTTTAAVVKNATAVTLPAITTGTSGTTTIGAGDISGPVTQSGTTAISTGTLTGDTTGSVLLANGNTLSTLGAFTSNGFILNDGAVLSITGTLAGGAGAVKLTSSGTISEAGGALISTTGTLTSSSVGGTTLGGANAVGGFNATNTTNGNISLTNAAALTITGISQSGGGAVTVNNAGGTTLTGAVGGAGTGAVTLEDASGTLALGTNNVTGAGVTLQGKGVTQSSGSTVDAGTGDILVNGGGGAVSMAGALTSTSNTATAATVRNATTVALPGITTGTAGTTTIGAGDISGVVTQSGTTTLFTGTLTGHTTSTVSLGNGNTIPTVGAFTSGGFTLNTGDSLSIAGALAGAAGGVHLTSSGTISESGGGLISTTGTLTTTSVGGTTLGGSNVVSAFDATNSTGGGVSLSNGAATTLTITGLSQSGGGLVSVTNPGPILLANTNSANGGLSLTSSAGGVTLGSTGADHLTVSGGPLSVTSDGSIIQQGGSSVTAASTELTLNSPAGDVILKNAGTMGTLTLIGTGHDLDLESTNQGQINSLLTGDTWSSVTIVDNGGAITLPNFTATGALAVTAPGIAQSAGPIVVDGLTNLIATGNPILLSGPGNSFGGNVAFTGSAVTLDSSSALSTSGTATGALSETAGGTISEGGPITLAPGNTATFTVNGATGDVNLGDAANDFKGDATTIAVSGGGVVGNVTVADTDATLVPLVLPAAVGSLTLSDPNAPIAIPAGALGGTLDVTAGGAITQTGALSVLGNANLDAGTNPVLLNNAGNSFFGNVAFNGTAVTLVSLGALSSSGTASGTLSETAGGTISEGGPITLAAGNTATFTVNGGTGDVNFGNPANDFKGDTTTIQASGGGTVDNVTVADTNSTFVPLVLPATLASLTLSDPNAAIPVPAVTLSGSLNVTANGAITQTGTLSVAGTSTLDAGASPVTLGDPNNNFVGNVAFAGTTVTLASGGALSSSGTATGSLTETAGGAITQNGALSVTGALQLAANAGASDITLANSANAFAGPIMLDGAGLTLANTDATTLTGTNTFGSLTLDAGGAVDFGPGTMVTNALVVQGLSGSGAAGGGVTQSGPLSVGGTTSIDAGTNAITLANAANAFVGPVTLTGGAVTLANSDATTLAGTSSAGALTLDAGGAVTFGTASTDSTAMSTLVVQGVSGSGAAGGAVSQGGGALSVSGTSNIDAGGNAITLGDSGNSFGGNVAFTGAAVTLASNGALSSSGTASGTLTESAGGSITQGGVLRVTGSSTLTPNGGDLTLNDQANAFGGNVAFNGRNVTLTTGTGGLSSSGVASGTLTETAAGSISQIGALRVTGTSTLTANGGGNITLANSANAFTGLIKLSSGGAVTLANTGATTLAGSDNPGSLTLDAGGAVTFGTASTDRFTVSNDLIVQGASGSGAAGGAVSEVGTLSVGGTTSINAGTHDITLLQANTFGGNVTFTGGNVALSTSTGSLTSSGTASGTLIERAEGASASLDIGNLSAGGQVLLIAGKSILGTSAQATVTANNVIVRYGLEDAAGQLGGTDPNQQVGFLAATGAQVKLTIWLPQPGTQFQNQDVRQTASDLLITRDPFAQGEQALLYSTSFALTPAEVAGTLSSIQSTLQGTSSQSAGVAQGAATQGTGSVLYIDWSSYNPNVSLFGTLNPAVCLPADQREEGVGSGSGSGCSAASASLVKPPAPIRVAMVPTLHGWKAMPLFYLAQ